MDRQDEIEAPVKAQPVVTFSIGVVCGDGRQISFNGHFGRDDDAVTQNDIIDRVMRIGNRQKATYDLEKEYKDFEQVGRTIKNFLSAIPMAEKNAKYQIAALKVEAQAKQEARDEVFNEAYKAHVDSHRKSAFVPSGNLKSRLAAMDSEIQKVKDKIAAVPADADQDRQKTAENVYRYQDDLKKRRVHINDLRKMAGLEPYTEFLDEEKANPLEVKGA